VLRVSQAAAIRADASVLRWFGDADHHDQPAVFVDEGPRGYRVRIAAAPGMLGA
jgi:hypothetical protein